MKIRSWSKYYKNTLEKEPNETVFFAEKKLSGNINKSALDIGSGTGCDSLYLLEKGFKVIALDPELEAINILKNKTKNKYQKELTFEHSFIQNYKMENNSFNLINASYSLPFCNKKDFEIVWRNILIGLKPNGLFAGQLFGVNDDWSGIPEMSFVTNEEVDKLLTGYCPEYYKEMDEEGTIADGSVKHWHLFNLVLRKI